MPRKCNQRNIDNSMEMVENIPSYPTTLDNPQMSLGSPMFTVSDVRHLTLQKWKQALCQGKQQSNSSVHLPVSCLNCGEQCLSSGLPRKGLNNGVRIRDIQQYAHFLINPCQSRVNETYKCWKGDLTYKTKGPVLKMDRTGLKGQNTWVSQV